MIRPNEKICFHGYPVAGVDAMTARTVRSFPRHTHDQYGIGLVDAGGHASWSGKGHVEAGPGQFICVNPGEVHDGRAIGGRPRAWRILYFETAVMDDIRADVLEGAATSFVFVSPVFDSDPLRGAFDTAFAYATAGAPPQTMSCETAMVELVANLHGHTTAATRNDRRPSGCIRRSRCRIDADPAAPVTLADLAKEAGLSRFQLLRAFARELGLTPHAYIVQRRIAVARELIRSGRALADVAVIAGFYDQSHLTRCFMRQYGVTPRRYANRSY
jgi:AraC-like DNA-binding protein